MRTRALFVTFALLAGALPVPAAHASEPMDALSVAFYDEAAKAEVSAWNGYEWTPWQSLAVENEQDPSLRESNLVLFPTPVSRLRFRGDAIAATHPIQISDDPVRFLTAALGDSGTPRILSRTEWGADESFLVTSGEQSSSVESADVSDTNGSSTGTPSTRVQDCKDAVLNYPGEFKSSTLVTENADGKKLRWPQGYSPTVRLLVVHHTALAYSEETRSGTERMRALYQYHAQNRGWGDIGYHFVIDETGKIFEGRAGGDSVVGGHTYCNNVGTIGVAMMGNFDNETPSDSQTRSLQWVLRLLADKYQIDLSRDTRFHGKDLPGIVGHRNLVSTDCPGTAVWTALDQIRSHVRTGNVDARVEYPKLGAIPVNADASTVIPKNIKTGRDGLAALSTTVIEGRPGAEVIIPVFFRADRKNYAKNARIARVTRGRDIGFWQEKDGKYVQARDIRLPVALKKGQSIVLRVRVRLPRSRGDVTLRIGSLKYVFQLSGRSVRGRQVINTSIGRPQITESPAPIQRTVLTSSQSSPLIRIRLETFNGRSCQGDAPSGYRGTVTCLMVDGQPAWINELPLEDYLLGLAEEPDTQPFEKQRAFAIAARTYALHYLSSQNRKFPGKPYDGSDSAASFQLYRGKDFEAKNPRWLQAVRDTAGKVLTVDGKVIKPPYFSSDDGRTRTPDEAGWPNFPFAHIFSSKPDPWCAGMQNRGHGVGMSGCGALGQAKEGKTGEQILQYYYPGAAIISGAGIPAR